MSGQEISEHNSPGGGTIYLNANGKTVSAVLEDNAAADALKAMLRKGRLTLSMSDNGGFEKVGYLPHSLPSTPVRLKAMSGDVMLYLDNVLCVFYGHNTWAYTKIATIVKNDLPKLKECLKGGALQLTLSLEAE